MKRRHQIDGSNSSAVYTEVLPITTQTQQVNTLPPLKLRIKQQNIVQEFSVFIYETTTSPREILKFLLHFHHQLRMVDLNSDECEQISRHLKDLVRRESDHLVRAKAVELISEVCYLPSSNKNQCIEDIFECLHKESKKKIFLLSFFLFFFIIDKIQRYWYCISQESTFTFWHIIKILTFGFYMRKNLILNESVCDFKFFFYSYQLLF